MNWSFRTGNWLFVQKVSHTDVFHQVYTSATGSDRFETNREIISKVEKNFCCFLYEKRIWKRMKKKFLIWVHDCNFFFKWEERQMVHHPSSFRDGPYCHFLHFTVSPLYLFLFLFLSGCCLAHLRASVCVFGLPSSKLFPSQSPIEWRTARVKIRFIICWLAKHAEEAGPQFG